MNMVHDRARSIFTQLVKGTKLSLAEVERWYLEHKQEAEEFTEFFIRQGVFAKDATRTLGLIAKGYLDSSCESTLVSTERWQQLLETIQANVKGSYSNIELTTTNNRMPSVLTETSRIVNMPLVSSHSTSARANSIASAIPACGTVLGKYLLTEQIGQGTSGLVFRAINQLLNLTVAVKVLRRTNGKLSEQDLNSLREEARLLASLNHPNVVRLWDFECTHESPYLVMEFVDGPSLHELIQQSGRIYPRRAIELTLQIVEGLEKAWEIGIVHRDIKPHNILITRSGEAKIADLGLAIVVDENENTGVGGIERSMVGTAAYMAPEQGLMSGGSIDFRADIYSLGATLYHAVTGMLPHAGTRSRELVVKHANERPIPPHERVTGLSELFSEVVLIMMATSPDDRYQSGHELREALRMVLVEQQPSQKPMLSEGSHRSRGQVRPSGFWRRLLTGN